MLVGLLGGSKLEIDLGRLMKRRLTVVGTVLRSRPLEERIAPVVHRVFEVEAAAEAHALMERNENFGKIVLSI